MKSGGIPRFGVRWRLMLFLIFPLTFVMSLDRTNIAVSAPIITKEYGFSLVEMSFILTAFSWTYALLQVPGGLMAERWGSRVTLALADIWWSLLTIATTLGWSIASFVGIRGALGIGQAADWPASVRAISRWFPASERARGSSILLGGLYLGPIIGTPLTVALVSAMGWKASFYIYGVVGLVLGLCWYWYFRDKPREHPSITEAEAAHIEQGLEAVAAPSREGAGGSDWRVFLSNYRFWAYGMQYFCLILIQSFYNTWLPTYLMADRKFSLASMGIGASLPWVAMFVMVFVAGQWQDAVLARTGSKVWARVPFAVAGFVLAASFLIMAARTADPTLMIIMLMVSLGSVALVQVSIWPTAVDLGGARAGSVSAWTNTWGNLSAAAGPIFTAFLVSISSWETALVIVSLAALVGAFLWLAINPSKPLVGEPEAALKSI